MVTTRKNGNTNYYPLNIKTSEYITQNETIEYTDNGVYGFKIEFDGNYELTIIGAGGGGARVYYDTSGMYYTSSGGGSGACFSGVVALDKGYYEIKVGYRGGGNASTSGGAIGEDSVLSKNGVAIITAGGGAGGTAASGGGGSGGSGGVLDLSNATIVSSTINSNGNAGSHASVGGSAAGGLSVFDNTNTGYGAGGSGGNAGVNGYFKIDIQKSGNSVITKVFTLMKGNERYL